MPSFCHITKEKISKYVSKTATAELFPGPFVFANNLGQNLLENEIYEASCLY